MTNSTANQLNVMIAHAGTGLWAVTLSRQLVPIPVGVHWTKDGDEAVGLAVDRRIDVAVVDESLPQAGGLDALRRIRRSGIDVPALLVAAEPDRRMMMDAMELKVFSVVKVGDDRDFLTPALLRILRQVFGLEWPGDQVN